jgi:hypothetical protein
VLGSGVEGGKGNYTTDSKSKLNLHHGDKSSRLETGQDMIQKRKEDDFDIDQLERELRK